MYYVFASLVKQANVAIEWTLFPKSFGMKIHAINKGFMIIL